MLIIGCDPGLTGAICLLQEGVLLELEDLRIEANETPNAKVNQRVSAEAMNDLLADWSARYDFARNHPHACLELAVPMPGMPSTTTASTFDSFGCLRTLFTLRMDLTIVHSQKWKRIYGLDSKKPASLSCARALYPEAKNQLSRAKDHNRAESILIGHWLYKTEFC